MDKFEFCFNGADGELYEFATLTAARKGAKMYTKEHPDVEVNIYGMSCIYYRNGNEEE